MTQGTSSPRLQAHLARAGVASRRAAEDLIREGRVSVNGRIVRVLGTRVDPRRDQVRVDGRRIEGREPRRYYLLHKPRGVVSTTHDRHARRTVIDFASGAARLFPVGRLDAASEGLLLLTNDGQVAQSLLHPSHQIPRTYRVSVDGRVAPDTLRALRSGVEVDGEPLSVRSARLHTSAEGRSVLELVLIEGRRHQIRKMLDAVGHPVRRLVRTRFGPLTLRGLAPGDCRPLRRDERDALQRLIGRPHAARDRQPPRS